MNVPVMGLEHVYWGLPIVIYPYISGLVAGSFIVGSLSKVFGQKIFEPIAKLSLLVTLAFLLVAPLAPLSDARQPSRLLELYTRAHLPYSPLGLFTMIWTTYVLLVLVEVYFAFRQDNIRLGQVVPGWRGALYRFFALGSHDLSERAQRRDHALLVFLASAGILLAFAFHGYIGFVFGAIKARPLWSNPLMPVLFIVSAIVSGVALMILVYSVVWRYLSPERRTDPRIIEGLVSLLMWTIFIDLFLDAVDLLNSGVSAYASGPVFQGFSQIFMGGPLTFMYWGLQLGFLVLALALTFFRFVRRSALWASLAALLTVISVYAMRYNTVIGGQLQPKVSQGLILYTPPAFGRASVQVVIGLFAIVLFIFSLLVEFLPWEPLDSLLSSGAPTRGVESGASTPVKG